MQLDEKDLRLMASTRDRMLLEAMERAESAEVREAATLACYQDVADQLAELTSRFNDLRRNYEKSLQRYDGCRMALCWASALASALAVILIAVVVG